ncbi:hypothetical protein [Pseudanabaena sp. UWO310]|uniref:hypothetical protein n=1 Tax=Pseudanabaena sp. UWO310 TaxID=2480795 RepID=UPI001158EB74|nr:hypothetical protein [Pseudanabaena sp. UWO310]TYQ31618.1 hypothetical protein PseudUWO310_02625 [Pseudanabaena sp. UWO310]
MSVRFRHLGSGTPAYTTKSHLVSVYINDRVTIPTPIKKTLLNNVDLMTGNLALMKAESLY